MHLRRRALMLAAAAALAAGGAACGGGQTSVQAALATIADRTDEQESMRMRASAVTTRGAERVEMTFSGTSTANSSAMRMHGVLREPRDEPMSMEMIIRGDELWMRSPQLADVMPAGKRWMHVRDKSMATTTMSPSDFVELLRDSETVAEAGREPLRGRPSTRYRGTVTVDELLDHSPPETRRQFAAFRRFKDLRIGVEVWVHDHSDLPGRMDLNIRAMHRGRRSAMRMNVDILEYGVPVNAEPPPADQVAEPEEAVTG
jgi:hypothetical protein